MWIPTSWNTMRLHNTHPLQSHAAALLWPYLNSSKAEITALKFLQNTAGIHNGLHSMGWGHTTEGRSKSLLLCFNYWRYNFQWHISFFSNNVPCTKALGFLYSYPCVCVCLHPKSYINISHKSLYFLLQKHLERIFVTLLLKWWWASKSHLINYWRWSFTHHADLRIFLKWENVSYKLFSSVAMISWILNLIIKQHIAFYARMR